MFENKKILILGFARSGYEAAKLLIKKNNDVTINDAKEQSTHDQDKINELLSLGVKFVFGSHPENLLDSSFDYLIKNPGVPIDHQYVLKAQQLNIEIINEAEMAYRLLKDKVKIIGITGTNGKTTTTTLIYEVLKASGLPVHIAGNIGFPLCGFIDKVKENDIIVMEVSAQQLENFKEFKPDIAVLTNLSEAHIDFFKTYEYYLNLKAKIFNNQTKNDIAILNYNDLESKNIVNKIRSVINYFSINSENALCYLKDNIIHYNNQKLIGTEQIKICGNHNYENIMAMIIVAKKFAVSDELIINVLKNFNGVEHRLEYVTNLNDRIFYNDAKATNIESTKIALSAFDKPTILIMGGLERNQDFNELNPYLKNVKLVVCYGQNKMRIASWLEEQKIKTIIVEDIVLATKEAYKESESQDIILLSPASASWDQFNAFEERGNLFKETIMKL